LTNFDETTGFLSQASPASAGPTTPSKGPVGGFSGLSPKLKDTPNAKSPSDVSDSVQKLALEKAMPFEPASSSNKKLVLGGASPKEKMPKKEKSHHPKDEKAHKEKKDKAEKALKKVKKTKTKK